MCVFVIAQSLQTTAVRGPVLARLEVAMCSLCLTNKEQTVTSVLCVEVLRMKPRTLYMVYRLGYSLSLLHNLY